MVEREAMVVAPQTLVVYAPFVQRLNVVVLRFAVRCNVGGCFWWMTAGQMHIACRLLPPQYRWPSSWSSRCCLCLVVSMTSGLVDVGLPWTLCEALFPPQDVRTSFWKECSRGAFVRSAVRRDLAHNLPDWGLGALVVCFASLLDHLQVAEDH